MAKAGPPVTTPVSGEGGRFDRFGRFGGTYGVVLLAAVSALIVLAVYIFSRFEIYERTRWVRPSAELRANNFYVLSTWLSESGHPVRSYPRWTGIKKLSPREGGLYIQASLFDWEEAEPVLVPWVEEGGSLVISLDDPWYQDDAEEALPTGPALDLFLEKLGIRVLRPGPENYGAAGKKDETVMTIDEDNEDNEDNGDDDGGAVPEDEEGYAAAGDRSGGDGAAARDFPDYDYRISFEDSGPAAPSGGTPVPDGRTGERAESSPDGRNLTLRDSGGTIRLVRRALGKGQVAVTGACFFMYNYHLDDEANARLAWELTGASLRPEQPGMFFVRGRRAAAGFFSALAERGNLMAPALSILILVLTGFLTVIPGFGVLRGDESKRPGAISGRFLAEARFLRRYGAFGVYLETYLRELRRRSEGRDLGPDLTETVHEVEDALAAGKNIGPGKMAVYLKNLMSALERI
jgi:hypothetical protein